MFLTNFDNVTLYFGSNSIKYETLLNYFTEKAFIKLCMKLGARKFGGSKKFKYIDRTERSRYLEPSKIHSKVLKATTTKAIGIISRVLDKNLEVTKESYDLIKGTSKGAPTWDRAVEIFKYQSLTKKKVIELAKNFNTKITKIELIS